MLRTLRRTTFLGLLSLVLVPLQALAAELPGDFDKAVQPYFEQHCLRCHNADKQKGEFRLDTLARDFGGNSAMHWAEVMGRISSGEMPPKKEPQPHVRESARVVEWLAGKLKDGEAARLARRERVSFHKLTRNEYANTVKDLLGVQFDPADPNGLPEDQDWHGFERIGSVLSISPSHIEKYFAAGETVLAEALPAPWVPPTKNAKPPVTKIYRKKDALDLRGGGDRAELFAKGLAEKVRVEMWPGHDIQGGRPGPGQSLPAAGMYRVRIQASGLQPPGGRAPHLALYAPDLDRMLFERDIVAPEDKPTIVEFTTHLPAGNLNLRLTNDVPGPSNLPRSGRSDPKRNFFSIKEGRSPWQVKLTDEEGKPLVPFLILDWIEWEGPITSDGPTYAQQQYIPTESGNLQQARSLLTRFAERAFRRPVKTAEVDRLVNLVESEMKNGEKFEAAYKTAMLAVLCSKDFLYVVEGNVDRSESHLGDWELASRLSYFLWETMPDDALFDAARDGTLSQPDVLRAQVRRMLADPKAERFVLAFTRQWLQLKRVGMFPPDKKLYPDYDAYLEKSMIGETTAFVGEVLRNNLSIREFIDSDWTMLNGRLAEHYQIGGVSGSDYTKVTLKPDDRRGGLLTQASVLSLTSDGTRHRPVHRGAWVLESIIGKPPPPPPANVKPIEPTPVTAPKATIRMKLAAHTTDPSCASCHAKIDPLGIAFDNYDAIGRWRTEEVVSDGQGQNPTVDASGELVDGRKFTDAVSFRKLLVADVDQFNAAFVEKLSTFAMRRAMTIDDKTDLNAIAVRSKSADYNLQSIVEELVLSELFKKR